ncbi:Bug family tripartite tricarboxylate transporter substrate binding protein [Piscinibacter sp.]|uniref:Bug family tripartite tricarboxylate transporter substrate binding protein n=1 Tax=Piscinibacter sp. TaxID=1903157 RepID=UPI002BE56BE8|nr:tripartite tricarboxylate transporter substrate binding protein [Albitalea sp.]HUG25642.1 tripartite tricarboxylate transporter substrate binding protein [Albitalea sp.]
MSAPLSRRTLLAAAAGSALGAIALPTRAASWATKPVRIVVPYPPGGSSDIIARLISQPLSEALGQPVVIENRAGANGNLGTDAVVRSAPDGHTLLLCDVGALAITGSVYTKLPFDPSRHLSGVAMLAYSPHMLVVHPSVPASTLSELVALSKKSPLNFAVTAIGSAPHLAGVAVQRGTGASWEYIPYKGGSQAIQDTIGGQAQVLMNGMLATLPHVQSGKLKAIAVSKRSRMALTPQLPTIAESGVPGFESGTWQGVLAPAGTPAPIVQALNAELVRIIRSPEIRARLVAQGAEVATMTPPEFKQFFDTERARWAKVVAEAGVRLD